MLLGVKKARMMTEKSLCDKKKKEEEYTFEWLVKIVNPMIKKAAGKGKYSVLVEIPKSDNFDIDLAIKQIEKYGYAVSYNEIRNLIEIMW